MNRRLRERASLSDLNLLTGAVFLSAAGDMLAWITLALLVHDLTGNGFIVSAFFAATMIPVVALAPVAGLMADRIESVRLIRIASLLSAGIAAGLAFSESVPLIIGLTAALAAASAISQPAEFALIPVVSGPDRLTRSNGLIESARYAGFAAGPLAAAALVAVGSIRLALLVNALSFLAITACTLLLRSRRPGLAPENRARHGRGRETMRGAACLWEIHRLRIVTLASTAALFLLSAFMTIELFWIKDELGGDDSVYAVTTAVWMISMVVGATVLATRIPIKFHAVGALAGLGIQGIGIGGPSLIVALPPLLIGCAIGGLGHGVKNTLTRTIIHEDVPEELHGRAFAAFNAMRNSAEVTALALGGMLVATAGPRFGLMIAGFGPLLIAIAALILLRVGSRVGSPGLNRNREALGFD